MRPLLIITLPLLLLAGCSPSEGPEIPEPTAPAGIGRVTPSGGMLGEDQLEIPETIAEGTFGEEGPGAFTYDPRIVPAGATAQVAVGRVAEGISVRLAVTGMLPRRTYGAHLHTGPCTAKPDGSGPHYQHSPSPKASAPVSASASAPGPDPSFANPSNEVWLDFTADRNGAATVTAVQQWRFAETAPPRSLVVHAHRTRTGPGEAGTAGDRVACLTLPG